MKQNETERKENPDLIFNSPIQKGKFKQRALYPTPNAL